MIRRFFRKLNDEKANSMVENAIVLPLILITVYALILFMFILHDRATLDAAAKMGTIYAARLIADPNYDKIEAGYTASDYKFNGVGNNTKPYRYFTLDKAGIETKAEERVKKYIEDTKIPGSSMIINDVDATVKNIVIYQDVMIKIDASYPMPSFFKVVGLGDRFDYTVTAKTAATDPDEFIRNADLAVDLLVKIPGVDKVISTIGTLGKKVGEFFKMD